MNTGIMIKTKISLPNAKCQLKTDSCVSRFSFHIFLLTFYILNSAFCIATAETRYVSKTGTSTPPYTTWETAADSIQECINICNAGDTIIVANGVYYENLIIDSALTLIGSSMDSTIIDGRGMGDFTITFNSSGRIENFYILGKGNSIGDAVIRNLQFTVNLWEIKNCKISEGNIGIGLVGGISTSIQAENIILKDLNRGFSLSSEGNNYLSNCLVILENQNSTAVSIGFAPQGTYHITNNIILFTGSRAVEIGISIGYPKQIYITNNIISGFYRNIFFDLVEDSAAIKNSLILHSNSPGSIWSQSDNLLLRNNIFLDNHTAVGGSAISMNYNLFWENISNLTGPLSLGDSDRVAYPMFIKDTVPNSQLNFDYHLQAYSPGIDKGDPNILDVDGSRSDIGAYGGPFGEKYTYKDLPPKPPVNLSGQYDSSNIQIKWNRNTEADTSHYNIYRDTIASFPIDSTTFVLSLTDTNYTHLIPPGQHKFYYKITAVDNQGNESLSSEELFIFIVSAEEYPVIINDYRLYQNYPNPFNPTTTIGYRLKERGYVKLMVYDIKGELVSILVNREQTTGYYEVEFDVKSQMSKVKGNLASGIYLYRIEVIGKGRIPVYSDMKKMLLIK